MLNIYTCFPRLYFRVLVTGCDDFTKEYLEKHTSATTVRTINSMQKGGRISE